LRLPHVVSIDFWQYKVEVEVEVSLPGGVKGRHAKTRQNHPENTLIRHGTNQPP